MTELHPKSNVAKLLSELDTISMRFFSSALRSTGEKKKEARDTGIEISKLSSSILRIILNHELEKYYWEDVIVRMRNHIEELESTTMALRVDLSDAVDERNKLREILRQEEEFKK